MKPPAASKFLQRGGLGEAHLDLIITIILGDFREIIVKQIHFIRFELYPIGQKLN